MDLVNGEAMNKEYLVPSGNRIYLQIQPQYVQHEEWMALSLREGLFFEPL